MKNHKLFIILACLVALSGLAFAESIQDNGTGYDVGALRKSVFRYYGGATTNPTYTDLGSNQIEVDACCVNLWDNPDFEGYPVSHTFEATTLTLTQDAINYIIGDYNSGSPVIRATTNVEEITESDIVPILTIYDQGGFLHSLNWDELGVGLPNKLHQRLVKTQRYQRESGLALSLQQPTINLSFAISSGKVWYGAVRQDVDAIDSLVDLTVIVAPDGSVTPVTAFNNTHYYNAGVYTELTPNRYAVNWVYRGIETQKHCYIMLGDGDYQLNEAQSAQPPARPAIISSHAQLVGKVIVQKNSNTVYSLQSAFDVQFSTAGISIHNDLTGLNEGEYQHLTVLEKDTAINGSDTLDFTAKTITVKDSVTVGTPELTISGDGLGNVTAAAASVTVNADVHFSGNVTGLPATVSVHNDLTGLNEGDYQHLTQAELLELQGLSTNYVATSSLVTTLLNYAALNGDSEEDFAIDHLSANTASFTNNVDVGGELSVGAATDMTIIGDGFGNVTIDTVATLTFSADSDFNGVVDLTDATVIGLSGGTTVHNDLTGLNDGDYQHLTVVEKDQALNGSDTLDFTVNTVTFTDAATTRTNLGLDTMALEKATDYVATSTLATTLLDYVTTTDLSTALSDYVTSSGLTTILGDYVQTTALGDMAYEDTTDYVATSAYAADMADKMDTDGSNAVGIEFFTADEKSVAINGSSTVDFLAEDITATTVTVSDGIDIGSTPDVSVSGDGAGTLTLDAETVDVTGDIEMSGNGAITNINNFGVTNNVVVNSSNEVTSGSLRAGLIYSLGSNLSVGTISSLKGIEMWFGSVGGGSSVISNAQGLILKPIAMGATTVTSMTALDIVPYSGGNQYTTAYGLRSQLAIASGKTTYNLYIDGTAPNYLKGDTKIDGDVILTPKAAPSGAVAGAIYYDSDDNHFYGYNGTTWVQLDN